MAKSTKNAADRMSAGAAGAVSGDAVWAWVKADDVDVAVPGMAMAALAEPIGDEAEGVAPEPELRGGKKAPGAGIDIPALTAPVPMESFFDRASRPSDRRSERDSGLALDFFCFENPNPSLKAEKPKCSSVSSSNSLRSFGWNCICLLYTPFEEQKSMECAAMEMAANAAVSPRRT